MSLQDADAPADEKSEIVASPLAGLNQASPLVGKPSAPKAKPNSGSKWVALAAVWLIVIVAVWFGLHPLFDIEFPLFPAEITARIGGALGGLLADVGLLILCSLASAAFGWWILEKCWQAGAARLSRAELAIFSLGLGLGLNILLIFGVGLLGGVNWVVAYGLLAGELGFLWLRRGLIRQIGASWRGLGQNWQVTRRWEKGLLVWLAFVGGATLLLALAPPLAWDALMYHLEIPRRYIEAGRIEAIPRNPFASYPLGAEMLFTWGMLLHGAGLAQAFSWLYGLLGAAACLTFAQRFFSRLEPRQRWQVGLLAAVLYLSSPYVWVLMTWAYTDLFLTFYTLLAFYLLLLAVQSVGQKGISNGYVILAGLMAGLAWSGKYTAIFGLIGAAGGAGLLALWQRPRPAWRQWFGWGLLFAVVGALTFAPWLIRNLIYTGNPLAPFYGGMRGWDAGEIAAVVAQDGGIPLDLSTILGRPFQMVLTGRTSRAFDATVTPLFLALLPLGVWAAFRERVAAATWLMIGLTYAGWLWTIRNSGSPDQTRLLLAVFPLLALITAYGVIDFMSLPRRITGLLEKLIPGVVGVFVVASAFMLSLYFVGNDPLPYHFGLQTGGQRVESQLGNGEYYRVTRFVNEQLPKDAKLFLFLEPRAYYFDRALSADHNNGGQFFSYVTGYKTAPAIYAELLKRGATHVLVNESLLGFLLNTPGYELIDRAKAGRRVLDELEAAGYFEKVYQERGQYTVYRLKPYST